MASPFDDGGQTRTIDIPPIDAAGDGPDAPSRRPAASRARSSLPWIVIIAAVAALLALVLLALVALPS